MGTDTRVNGSKASEMGMVQYITRMEMCMWATLLIIRDVEWDH